MGLDRTEELFRQTGDLYLALIHPQWDEQLVHDLELLRNLRPDDALDAGPNYGQRFEDRVRVYQHIAMTT